MDALDRKYLSVRWILLVFWMVPGAINLNAAVFFAWQTAAPPGYENPQPFALAASRSFGLAVACILVGCALFLNIRPGWPFLRSWYTWILAISAVIALSWSFVAHYLAVDRCLDAGGQWHKSTAHCVYAQVWNEARSIDLAEKYAAIVGVYAA